MQWQHVQHIDNKITSINKSGLKKTCGHHTKIQLPTGSGFNLIYGSYFVYIEIPPNISAKEITLKDLISFYPKTYTTWQVGTWVTNESITAYQQQMLQKKNKLIQWLQDIQ